jgi:hypothetical protein
MIVDRHLLMRGHEAPLLNHAVVGATVDGGGAVVVVVAGTVMEGIGADVGTPVVVVALGGLVVAVTVVVVAGGFPGLPAAQMMSRISSTKMIAARRTRIASSWCRRRRCDVGAVTRGRAGAQSPDG